jgi:t-SNARE complex subunit (syntaxin)
MQIMTTYQTIQQNYKHKYQEQMERQFRIIKPDATPEEIRSVVNADRSQDFKVRISTLYNTRCSRMVRI